MDSKRAIQIMESHGVIEVTHQGSPVWLESVKGHLAEVTYIKTGKSADVPLNELVEGD